MLPEASGPRLTLCEFADACVFLLKIYVHLKEGGGPDGLDALKNKPQLHGTVARSLCRNAAGKNYIIFTGPSITSLTLFEELEKQGLLCDELVPGRPLLPGEVVGRPGGCRCVPTSTAHRPLWPGGNTGFSLLRPGRAPEI